MDDKPSELAALQEKVLKTLEAVATLIANLDKDVRESNELRQARLKQEMAHLTSVPAQSVFLGGQFRRRDGDGFGSVPRKFTQDAPNADNKTGDI